ncbi:hypothetical protein [Rhodopila sp.]|uniref:hypothetical protein n=1 Tax=Rhodopila sp. TaxID=2480087 RepID=UPI003D141480
MSDTEFDTALVTAAFRLAGDEGWRGLNVAKAARAAGLSVAEARGRFPSRTTILMRFGRLADQAALLDAPDDGPVRDRLFDLLMRRFDVLQTHRAGVKALLRYLPTDPPTALLLASATQRSMRWMLQGAGITATGVSGALQERGLLAIWLWAMRAWERDETEDLSGTMAAVDSALQRADRLAAGLQRRRPTPPLSDGAGELDPAHPPPPDAAPPSGLPPTGAPPAGTPPSGLPPTGTPPSGTPPTGTPPTGTPPTAIPPSAIPPSATPSTATPPSAMPPSGTPSTETPPTEMPPSAVPPTGTPPTGPPTAGTPAAGFPPPTPPPAATPPTATRPSGMPPTARPPATTPPTPPTPEGRPRSRPPPGTPPTSDDRPSGEPIA